FRSPPPDTTIDGAAAGDVVYRAASVRGLNHREQGEPRQGSYTVQLTEDQEWLVGCISDGVSAAARSHEATAVISDRISRALVEHLAASPPSDDPGRWENEIGAIPWTLVLRSVNDAVCELAWPYLSLAAQQKGTSLDPAGLVPQDEAREIMAGTALAFVVATKASPDGVHRAMLARVAGDSAVFTLRGEQWIPLARVEDDDEDEAAFWSPVEALPGAGEVETRSFSLRPGEPLIVMTNDLGDPLETVEEPVSGFLTDRWRTPPDLLEFAQHLAFYRKTFTGDRTAIAVWPSAG
ncbi:MAG TPA: protein phosphatase 2C domain-containing protein, partial [Actinoplanes sp.]|nr:protein phosphatase 2C domain-containing protein [Actinoplanes sp.]